MINFSRFIHTDLNGNKYVYNNDLLKLNIDNKEYNSLKRLLKNNNINVLIVVKERKIINEIISTSLETESLFNSLKRDMFDAQTIREKIIKGNMHIVNYLLFKNYILYDIDYEDYSSYAYEALIESVDNYLTSDESNFYNYSSKKINNRILEQLLNDTGIKISNYSKFLSIKKELEIESGKDLSKDNYDVYETIITIMLEKGFITSKEYGKLLKKDEKIEKEECTNYFLIENENIKIDNILSNIKVKYENIIRLYFGIGQKKHTKEQIGNIYGWSKTNIGRHMEYALLELKRYILSNYGKEDVDLFKIARSNHNDNTCITDVPFNEDNINRLFNDYVSCKKIDRYQLRLFDINRKYIINQALTGNDKAMFLALRSDIILNEYAKFISVSTAKKYYYEEYKVNGFDMFNFSTKSYENKEFEHSLEEIFLTMKYGTINNKYKKWLKDNKSLLMKEATRGNSKAMYICLRTVDSDTGSLFITPLEAINFYPYNTTVDSLNLYNGIKYSVNISTAIDLLFDYYKRCGHIPNEEEQYNEYGISFNSLDKDLIISMALKGNDKAMFICLRLMDSNNNQWITREEAKNIYPEKYEIDGLNMYKNDISDQLFNKKIILIFNILKSYGGLTRRSNAILKNRYKINIAQWIEENKEVLLNYMYNKDAKVTYILLHTEGNISISIKDLLNIYPINFVVDNVFLYSNIKCYGKDSIYFLYEYHKEYKSFIQDTVTKNKLGIDTRMLFIQNKEIIYEEVKKNNFKAKHVYSEALRDFENKVVTTNAELKNIKDIINQVYDDYMINGIKPNKSNNSLWLLKHQKELINEVKNKNMKAYEVLNSYSKNYIEISSINTQALALCLEYNWILRRDARCLSTYYRLKKYEKELKK